jgi:hypothetical protein
VGEAIADAVGDGVGVALVDADASAVGEAVVGAGVVAVADVGAALAVGEVEPDGEALGVVVGVTPGAPVDEAIGTVVAGGSCAGEGRGSEKTPWFTRDGPPPRMTARAITLVARIAMPTPKAATGAARAARSRIHSERRLRSNWAESSVCWFNQAM